MRAQMEYKEKLTDLKSPCSTLEDAIKEILDCETLTQLLLVVLTTGNIINGVSPLPLLCRLYLLSPLDITLLCQGTFAGNAYGFTVDSLEWLKETKSRHPKVSFLHFVAEVCYVIIPF